MKNLQRLFALGALTLVLFSFSNCGGTQNTSEIKQEQNAPFTVESATYQKWVAGINGGGSGIYVDLTLTSKQGDVKMKEIYFNGTSAPLTAIGNGDLQYTASFKTDLNSGDSTIMDSDPIKEAQNTPPEKFPFELADNEAILNYDYKGKTGFLKIEMTRKESISYPGTNPNNIEN